MNIVKVSVESLDGKQNILYDYDKSISLEMNVVHLLAKFEMPTKTHAYGLKLVQTNNGKLVDLYLTDDNYDDIKDGYFLKIAYALSHQVNTIFLVLEKGDRKTCFENIAHLYLDKGFIKELVKQDKHLVLLNFFVHQYDLTNDEAVACLLTIIHLFKLGYIDTIDEVLLDKLMAILQLDAEMYTDQIKYTISLLQKIMSSRNPKMEDWKEVIIQRKPLQELTPYIRIHNQDLQYLTISLINSFVRYSTGIRRLHFIKEMNFKQTKADISNHIIEQWPNLDSNMEYELYVYQTYLLSLYTDALNSKTKLDNKKRVEFELDHHHRGVAERLTSIIEFEESMSKMKSTENLLMIIEETDRNSDTCSLGSMESIIMRSRSNLNDDQTEEISYLTLGCLAYYKKFHHKNFYQTQIDETFFGPGIFSTSESVVRILANVLQIGKELEVNRAKCTFQPTIFYSTTTIKTPFFYELFSRTIWILSKTKNEMQGCPVPEYPKLMKVLEKQVKMVLEKRPGSFKKLTNIMLKTNYEAVKQKWQEENSEEFEYIMKHNPCVQELREKYIRQNEILVVEQRMNYLTEGSVFYRVNDQKKIEHCFIKLFGNRKQLLFYEYDEKLKRKKGDPDIISISSISHLVEGKACPHKVNNITKDNSLIFSLIIEHTTYINIIAKDLKEGSYWLDGFHILLEKDTRSEAYNKELQELVRMDLSLHLLELQNVTIPKKPPPVPPLPQFPEKPPVPAKSPGLRLLKIKKSGGKGTSINV
ncbi:engulfment and cell motility protein 2-like [Coccinella septempunctata]|uniref:engulfment and cell motility protein 2-like n=1 Tax=Coccinella septempunctata TaxID=41139 RepID=UPI001D0970DE|nr:engulfment and cell motility protein 2-like [Coccinella septempunctata]